MKLSRRVFLAGSMAVVGGRCWPFSPISAASAREADVLAGVNLAGADFGTVPGVHGTEYLYPTPENIGYYRDLGFRLIRLPFKWERLQPELVSPFSAEEQQLLQGTVVQALARGMTVVIDPHNYAKRRLAGDNWSQEHLVGSEALPAETLYDFWARLAPLFADEQAVQFGLMNEPVGLDPESWLDIANGTIAAIRGTGAENLILVPGVEYTGAHSWLPVGNTAMGRAIDPLGRIAFEVHQYFDENSSGTQAEAVSGTIGAERIEAFQEWARAHDHKAFLGEFGAGSDPASLNALADICAEMEANRDVWIGWAAWAGGPRWPDDNMHTLEPYADTGREREQTTVLKTFAEPNPGHVWAMPGAVVDIDLARGRAFGVEHVEELLVVSRPGEAYAPRRSGALDRFAADTPRITDRGLLIEEERRNLFRTPDDLEGDAWTASGRLEPIVEAGFEPGIPAWRLNEDEGEGWCALSQQAEFPSSGPLVASIHARHVSRRWLTIRGDRPSSAYAAFDTAEASAGATSGGAARRTGYRWGWQRLALAWDAEAAGNSEIIFSLQDTETNAAPFNRMGAATKLSAPMLEQGSFPTSYHPARRAGDVVSFRGPLQALLAASEGTLVIELRDLPLAAVRCGILGSSETALLTRTEAGALHCGLGEGLATAELGNDAWHRRIKIAIAFSSRSGSVAIAAMGTSPQTFNTVVPDLSTLGLGSSGATALNGRVTRIVGFDHVLDASRLAELTA